MARFDTRDLGGWEQDVATLAGSLVHEVKNPLSTLNINAQLLLEEFMHPASPREQRVVKRLNVMASEVGRIEQIVDTFLRFTQPQDLARGEVSLTDLLSDLRDRYSEAFGRSGIRILWQPAADIPKIEGDERLLHQAFLNLMVNAQQAMPEGGELILRAQEVGETIEVEVIDTGKGIPEETLPKIFRPYFSSKSDGTGLGLPTTLRIIRAHGGELRVESERGKGSRFVVSIPLTASPQKMRDA